MIAKRLVEAEPHQLKTPFEEDRIVDPKMVDKLATSMAKSGQKMPLIAVDDGGGWTLIDGYHRLVAARQCGWDQIWVELWSTDVRTGLIQVLCGSQARRFEAIEEGRLIQKLVGDEGLSQREVAELMGREPSWVSRRLKLVEALSPEILAAVRRGDVPAWSASRVLVPMARANPEHALRLVAAMGKEPLSTRQLETFFKHYQKASRTKREEMIARPSLFIRCVETREQEREARVLERGPEGKLLKTLSQIKGMLFRLRRELKVLHYDKDDEALSAFQMAFDEVHGVIHLMAKDLKRSSHDRWRDETNHCDPVGKRNPDPGDQPNAGTVAECGSPGSEEPRGEGAASAESGRADKASVCAMSWQRGPDSRAVGGRARSRDRLLDTDADHPRGPPA